IKMFIQKRAEITVRILQFRGKTLSLRSENKFGRCRFKDNRTRLHPIRTAGGSFFYLYGQSETKNRTRTSFHPEKQGGCRSGTTAKHCPFCRV
ncbi:hypothetical protein, partial [Parabacteroides merdae]|uniref:hypothetical protein n=1 Tax=Parabacteroides merdae TaxID=46503 RepID=UPI001E32B790